MSTRWAQGYQLQHGGKKPLNYTFRSFSQGRVDKYFTLPAETTKNVTLSIASLRRMCVLSPTCDESCLISSRLNEQLLNIWPDCTMLFFLTFIHDICSCYETVRFMTYEIWRSAAEYVYMSYNFARRKPCIECNYIRGLLPEDVIHL